MEHHCRYSSRSFEFCYCKLPLSSGGVSDLCKYTNVIPTQRPARRWCALIAYSYFRHVRLLSMDNLVYGNHYYCRQLLRVPS
jgi:hypothetical protein